MEIDPKQLAKFLVKAKINAYAGDGAEVSPQRPGFYELEYKEGDLEYRDSYVGFYLAPGQEVVRLNGKPIWMMAYNGGMGNKHWQDKELADKTFLFLKKALKQVPETIPFRGPANLKEGDFEYTNEVKGDIRNFLGTERIFYKGEEVFRQDYMGGLVLPKK